MPIHRSADALFISTEPRRFAINLLFPVEFPCQPVWTEELPRMLRPVRGFAATQVIGGALFVAPPANPFRVFWIQYQSVFRHGVLVVLQESSFARQRP